LVENQAAGHDISWYCCLAQYCQLISYCDLMPWFLTLLSVYMYHVCEL